MPHTANSLWEAAAGKYLAGSLRSRLSARSSGIRLPRESHWRPEIRHRRPDYRMPPRRQCSNPRSGSSCFAACDTPAVTPPYSPPTRSFVMLGVPLVLGAAIVPWTFPWTIPGVLLMLAFVVGSQHLPPVSPGAPPGALRRTTAAVLSTIVLAHSAVVGAAAFQWHGSTAIERVTRGVLVEWIVSVSLLSAGILAWAGWPSEPFENRLPKLERRVLLLQSVLLLGFLIWALLFA